MHQSQDSDVYFSARSLSYKHNLFSNIIKSTIYFSGLVEIEKSFINSDKIEELAVTV